MSVDGDSPTTGIESLFTVVVPAYNEQEFLAQTLAALKCALAAQDLAGELIVVDNNSTDATREIAVAAGARVVAEGKNQISRARNAGARASKSPYLIFVDADTQVTSTLIAAALTALTRHNVCGGGALLKLDSDHRFGKFAAGLWNAFARRAKYAAGCFVFCRRDAFEAVGGFSERVYASEEIWLARALKKWGKASGLEFVIIEQAVLTSGRKLEWLSGLEILKQFLIIAFFPYALRSKRFCNAWYRRPTPRAEIVNPTRR